MQLDGASQPLTQSCVMTYAGPQYVFIVRSRNKARYACDVVRARHFTHIWTCNGLRLCSVSCTRLNSCQKTHSWQGQVGTMVCRRSQSQAFVQQRLSALYTVSAKCACRWLWPKTGCRRQVAPKARRSFVSTSPKANVDRIHGHETTV